MTKTHDPIPVDATLGIRLIKLLPSGVPRLASKLKLSDVAIYKWTEVPLARVLEVEKATGLRRELLRPDVFLG